MKQLCDSYICDSQFLSILGKVWMCYGATFIYPKERNAISIGVHMILATKKGKSLILELLSELRLYSAPSSPRLPTNRRLRLSQAKGPAFFPDENLSYTRTFLGS